MLQHTESTFLGKLTLEEQIGRLIEISSLNDDQFLIAKETLTRIGIASDATLYQSCHVFQKRGKYYIVHFKELFGLDGKDVILTEEDVARRNKITELLASWNIIKPLAEIPKTIDCKFTIIAHSEKQNWTLVPKYTIGKKHNGTQTNQQRTPRRISPPQTL